MAHKEYVEGFVLYAPPKGARGKPDAYAGFAGSSLTLHIDGIPAETLDFKDADHVTVNGDGPWQYEALPVKPDVLLLTVHMLAKELPQYAVYVVDLTTRLVTRVWCKVTEIEKGSSPLSDTNNLVVREISFGYFGDNDPVCRHHYTHDLCDAILETAGSPGNVIRYYVHSDTKLSYYQKEWPLGGNPIDKDGVGYGEASFLKIRDDVYVITFTKHSHGNQPFMLWNCEQGNWVGNFAGVSRQSGRLFVTTGGSYLRQIY